MEHPKLKKRKAERKKEREAQRQQYAMARLAFLKKHPYCQVGDTCLEADPFGFRKTRVAFATDVHHKRGRGPHHMDQRMWLAVCRGCHEKIERERTWAQEKGYLLTRH